MTEPETELLVGAELLIQTRTAAFDRATQYDITNLGTALANAKMIEDYLLSGEVPAVEEESTD